MVRDASNRLTRLKHERPRVYAARHVARGAGEVLLAVVGIGLLIRFLPLPDVPLPNIDLLDLPFPDVSLPDWLSATLRTSKFWAPIVIGALIALAELEKRRGRQRES
jgi:hypothetical protein